jgi:hypothetical protein
MSLVLEIEHLLGVAFAARGTADGAADWPPQPDRVFSALVAAWGARDRQANERSALQWLERQPVPEIAASGGIERTSATVFVPPNDPESGRVANRFVMPGFRPRQPRRFPAYRPHDPLVRLVWRDAVTDEATLSALTLSPPTYLTSVIRRASLAVAFVPMAQRSVAPLRDGGFTRGASPSLSVPTMPAVDRARVRKFAPNLRTSQRPRGACSRIVGWSWSMWMARCRTCARRRW